MTLGSWKKLSESILLKNAWWTYKRDTFQLPSGKPGEYHYVHTNGSSMVVPLLGDGTLVLVNQARHELNEETGYSAKEIFSEQESSGTE